MWVLYKMLCHKSMNFIMFFISIMLKYYKLIATSVNSRMKNFSYSCIEIIKTFHPSHIAHFIQPFVAFDWFPDFH